VWLLGIGSDNVRKVFLSTPSSSLSPSLLSDVDSSQATLATFMDREMARLKAELEHAKAAMASMATTLFTKEGAIRESEQRFSHLSSKYHKEVTEHRQARSELRAKDSEIQRLKEVQATTHSFSPAPTSTSTHFQTLKPASPKKRELKRGAEILFRGYGRPQRTAVPECTASDGYHHFSGSGTNGYARRYTCRICDFVCSESKR
jgi:hypothetical protein